MMEPILVEKIDLYTDLHVNQVNEIDKGLLLSDISEGCKDREPNYKDSNVLVQSINKNDTSDILYLSDEDSSMFITERFKDLSPMYSTVPSMSKLGKMKQILSEVNDAYVNWKISELLLSMYKTIYTDMPPQTVKKIKDIIASSSVLLFKTMKSRRGMNFNLLGLEDVDFVTLEKKTLLYAEKKELTNKMITSLNITMQTISKEKGELKGVFGSNYLKVTPADTALSEERVQQAHVIDQMKLRLDQGYGLLMSDNEIMNQLNQIEMNTVQKLQNTSYLSLKNKARFLCNYLSVLKHKMDQISLADMNHTRSVNTNGEKLKISVNILSEKRKTLLKMLEKYERKEKASSQFRDIVAEYAKTKRLLNHKLQTLKVLNEPDEGLS